MKRKFTYICRCSAAVLLSLLCFLTTGCGKEIQEEEDNIVIIEQSKENPYTLTTVSRNNLTSTVTIPCTYKQLTEEEIAMPEGGRTVTAVYVEEGDRVVKGELLIQLSGGNHEEEIRQLEYRIARTKLLLEHTEMDEAYDLSYRWWTYIYQSAGRESDKERLDEDLKSIQQNYRYKREDYEDAIEQDTLQLELLRKEMEESRICVGADGEVSYVKTGMEGQAVPEGTVVLRVADSTQSYFETGVGKGEYASYFQEGVSLEITVRSDTSQATVEIIPYDMDNWGDRLTFVLAEENENIKVGMRGNIVLTGDVRESVLLLPTKAVHSADGRDYVYVLGGNDIPEVKWIETGMRVNGQVEILGGLEEGEYVILK